MKKTTYKLGLLAGLFVIASAALAQGPGDPLGDKRTNLSKKPGGTLAMGMGSDDINKGLGPPNSMPRSAGFTANSVSTVPLASESVWEYTLEVNIPYAWNAEQSTWTADAARKGEVRVFRHIGFDREGKAVVDIVRVVNPLGRGVEMTSAILGLSENGKLLEKMEVLADDAQGMRPASLSSLANAAGIAQLIPVAGGEGGLARSKVFAVSASGLGKSNLVIAKGVGNGQPVLVLGNGWDVNPVGTLGSQVPDVISPLLWDGGSAPSTGGKGGGTVSVQGNTVPGIDIIIKKCPCGIISSGSVGVVTNVTVIAVGAFDERKLRELYNPRRMRGGNGG